MRRSFLLALAAPVTLIAFAAVTAIAATPAADAAAKAANLAAQPAGVYEVEPTHTSVHWRIDHSGLSIYTARFDRIAGTINFNPLNPTTSSADITIDATSVNTGLPKHDANIAKQVFKAETNPTITFKSTSLTATSATTGTMTGDLTVAGVTKPVTLNVTYNAGRMSVMKQRQNIGFSATGSIKRSEWGMNNWINFGIGDQVDLIIEAEFLKKD
ncbi:MAG: polyisoprenoid-binding protein [Alphaproteobacteria bacterium PA3]|nr:MAG: polyisoprenoid-binding protein [Alphaproteobacteria bacterium PA3]